MTDKHISKELSDSIEQAFEEWSFSEKPVYEAKIKPENNSIVRQILSSSGTIHSSVFSKRVNIKGTPIENYSNPSTENNEPLYFLAEKHIIRDNGELFLVSKVKLSRFTTNRRNHEFTLRTSYASYRNFLNLDWQVIDFSKLEKPLVSPNPIIEMPPATPVIIPKEIITETTVKSYSPAELTDLIKEQFNLSTMDFKGDIYRTENYMGASLSKDGKFNPSAFTRFTQPMEEYYPVLISNLQVSSIQKGTPLGYSVFLNPDNPNKYLAGIVVFDKVDQNIPRFRATLQTNDRTWMKTQRLDVWKKFQRDSSR
jgi:hypothetical protein